MTPKRIGLDLDNTVIDYGPAYPAVAEMMDLDHTMTDRASIRTSLRRSDVDDEDWQRFQSKLYTVGLAWARPASGLHSFLNECARRRIDLCLISHKTETTPERFGGEDLRGPAMRWLSLHEIVPQFVEVNRVYFCASRAEKIHRIDQLRCNVFIDDLGEVLLDPAFPPSVTRFHYTDAPGTEESETGAPRAANFPSLTAWLQSC